jgi:hypothetical protein
VSNANEIGVLGESAQFEGVRGVSHAASHGAVVGINDNDTANPDNPAGPGVFGKSKGTGVWGESKTWMGVYGNSQSTTGGAGVMGEAVGPGVVGKSQTWMGIYGETQSTTGGAGVWGEHKANGIGTVGKSAGGVGVWGESETNEGVHAETKSMRTAAIAAYQLNPASESAALFAKHMGNRTAGVFEGDVHVSGSIQCQDLVLAGADCAEEFDVADFEWSDPGTVMVIGDEGSLHPCIQAYDRRVGGVISGAESYAPAITLDKTVRADRKAIALVGKVFCKADAAYGPIRVGDLLTTSPTHGHAMKATEPLKAFGAVLGKALASLESGRGFIPILVALQ